VSNGPDRNVLFFFGLLAAGGFFYARYKWLQNTGGKPVQMPEQGPVLAATFSLPGSGPGGTAQSITIHPGEHIRVTGSELPSAGQLWRAAETSPAIGVDVEHQSNGVSSNQAVFDVHALEVGTGTVYFTLTDPEQNVLRSWNLEVTVEKP
jgi:hypothetical protein